MQFDYKIFQVKQELTRQFGFMRLADMIEDNIPVSLNNYNQAYSGTVDSKKSVFDILEMLYEDFNIHFEKHPEYRGRSMSVSDIVKIDERYFYCDFIGFTEIEFVGRMVTQD